MYVLYLSAIWKAQAFNEKKRRKKITKIYMKYCMKMLIFWRG